MDMQRGLQIVQIKDSNRNQRRNQLIRHFDDGAVGANLNVALIIMPFSATKPIHTMGYRDNAN